MTSSGIVMGCALLTLGLVGFNGAFLDKEPFASYTVVDVGATINHTYSSNTRVSLLDYKGKQHNETLHNLPVVKGDVLFRYCSKARVSGKTTCDDLTLLK